jgi:hypothetical protein
MRPLLTALILRSFVAGTKLLLTKAVALHTPHCTETQTAHQNRILVKLVSRLLQCILTEA